MERKPRSLTVSESADYHPRIILKGKWLQDWGFTKGDKVLVTCTDTGDILIKFDKPSTVLSVMRRQHESQHGAYLVTQLPKPSPARLHAIQQQLEKAHEAMRHEVWARVSRRRR